MTPIRVQSWKSKLLPNFHRKLPECANTGFRNSGEGFPAPSCVCGLGGFKRKPAARCRQGYFAATLYETRLPLGSPVVTRRSVRLCLGPFRRAELHFVRQPLPGQCKRGGPELSNPPSLRAGLRLRTGAPLQSRIPRTSFKTVAADVSPRSNFAVLRRPCWARSRSALFSCPAFGGTARLHRSFATRACRPQPNKQLSLGLRQG